MTTLSQKVAEFPADTPDWQIANALNTKDAALPTVYCDVVTVDAREVLLATGEWSALVIAAENEATPALLRGACIVARDTLTLTQTIRTSNQSIRGAVEVALNGLVLGGIIAQSTKDAVSALMITNQSWAEANGVEVTPRTVGLARGAI